MKQNAMILVVLAMVFMLAQTTEGCLFLSGGKNDIVVAIH